MAKRIDLSTPKRMRGFLADAFDPDERRIPMNGHTERGSASLAH